MEKEKEGFPITSLREINTLLKAQHPNIVTVRVSAGTFLNNIITVGYDIFFKEIPSHSWKKRQLSFHILKAFFRPTLIRV